MNFVKRLFKRKKEIAKIDTNYGAKQFSDLEKEGIIEGGSLEVTRFMVATNHIWRAWIRGYRSFEVIYTPHPVYGPVSIDTINRELGELQDLGVKFDAIPLGKDSYKLVINR